MEPETKEILKGIMERLGDLRSIFSPVVPDSLAVLDGWTWSYESKIDRTILNRGDQIDVFARALRGQTDQRGWINALAIIFSDPDSELIFSMDAWSFRASPRLLNMLGGVLPNNMTVYNVVYNPATLLGPVYGIVWSPSQFWPYKTQITFQASHPLTAVAPTSQIVLAGLGRMFISDEKYFYESIFLESQRQTIGKVQVPVRRPT